MAPIHDTEENLREKIRLVSADPTEENLARLPGYAKRLADLRPTAPTGSIVGAGGAYRPVAPTAGSIVGASGAYRPVAPSVAPSMPYSHAQTATAAPPLGAAPFRRVASPPRRAASPPRRAASPARSTVSAISISQVGMSFGAGGGGYRASQSQSQRPAASTREYSTNSAGVSGLNKAMQNVSIVDPVEEATNQFIIDVTACYTATCKDDNRKYVIDSANASFFGNVTKAAMKETSGNRSVTKIERVADKTADNALPCGIAVLRNSNYTEKSKNTGEKYEGMPFLYLLLNTSVAGVHRSITMPNRGGPAYVDAVTEVYALANRVIHGTAVEMPPQLRELWHRLPDDSTSLPKSVAYMLLAMYLKIDAEMWFTTPRV